MLDILDIQALFSQLNALHFANALPPCQIRWSRRLTRAAGLIRVQTREISLSIPLLIEAFADGKTHVVCGVVCCSSEQALRVVLEHEMIHLWLFERGLPCGHTKEFRAKAREIGHGATRHAIERPAPRAGWRYECGACGSVVWRRRRFGRAVACGACCRLYTGGVFDARFQLRGRRMVASINNG